MIIEECPLLVEFFTAVFDIMASCSLTMNENGEISHEGHANLHPFTGWIICTQLTIKNFTGNAAELRSSIGDRLNTLFDSFKERSSLEHGDRQSEPDTYVYPFLQMKSVTSMNVIRRSTI